MASSPNFTFRLPEKDRKALERLAKTEERPVSALARKIITDWLRKQQEKRA
jgi:predicted transcriptional regulator